MAVQTLKPRRPASRAAVSEPSHEEIAARAYARYEARGASDGDDLTDWLEAEHELLQEHGDRVRTFSHPDD